MTEVESVGRLSEFVGREVALNEIRGGAQATWKVSVEREGGGKPCCVAEWLVRYYV
jgi:hypothetical protein